MIRKILQIDLPFELPNFTASSIIFKTAVLVNILLIGVSAIRAQGIGFEAGYYFFQNIALIAEFALVLTLFTIKNSWNLVNVSIRKWLVFIVPMVYSVLTAIVFQRAFNLSLLLVMLNCFLLTLCVVVYFDWRYRRLSPVLVEAQLQALQSRIRPHFFFNAINGIVLLLSKNPKAAEEALLDLADLFRGLMKETGHVSSVEQEINLAKKYLKIEKLRFQGRLDSTIVSDPVANDCEIPTLLIQPLVENAVIHGIETVGSGGVLLRVFVDKDFLNIIVENPFSAEGKKRETNKMATENIKKRLELIYDKDASIYALTKENIWRVHIKLPKKEYKKKVSRSLN